MYDMARQQYIYDTTARDWEVKDTYKANKPLYAYTYSPIYGINYSTCA